MRRGTVAAFSAGALALSAASQAEELHPELDGVKAFAPIVWLSPDDEAFPVIPNPFAFDAIDNDGDGRFDIEDPDEVAWSWQSLRNTPKDKWRHYGHAWGNGRPFDSLPRRVLYAHPERFGGWGADADTPCLRSRAWALDSGITTDASLKAPECAAELRVDGTVRLDSRCKADCPDDREVVFSDTFPRRRRKLAFYETERGDWRMLVGPRGLREYFVDRDGQPRDLDIGLYQFWFYYPFDKGPNPHEHDAEHVSIFVESKPRTPPGPLADEFAKFGTIKAIVGVGHGADTGNNILVRRSPESEALLPRELRPHMPVLVELGKHASAPDRNCNGRFDPGVDANIYPEAAWGSRDLWAGNVGQELKVGDFALDHSWMRPYTSMLLETAGARAST